MMSSSSQRSRSKKKTNAAEASMPGIVDPFAGVSMPPAIASMLRYDNMLQHDAEKRDAILAIDKQIEEAEQRARADGRDPRQDGTVNRLVLAKLHACDDTEGVERFHAKRLREMLAHSTSIATKGGTCVPTHEMAKQTFWPDRRLPDDQTAHVMWARALSILNKYHQITSMQHMMSGDSGRKNLYMPHYHDYAAWIEQHFQVPVVFVRRNSTASQTWLGDQDRQPVFYMQRPFDVPMPQSNHHGAFKSKTSQNDDLLHEVRYLNILELTSLALFATARPGACFEYGWDGSLPGTDAYDICPDRIAKEHRFVWTEEKARQYGGDSERAMRYVCQSFPEQRIEVYETFVRFDRTAFAARQAQFTDDPSQYLEPQHREVLFDEFYVHAHTYEEPMEDGRLINDLHADVQRLFRCREQDQHKEADLFPTPDEVLAILETRDDLQWSERRRTSPYDVVVDEAAQRESYRTSDNDDDDTKRKTREDVSEDDEFPYDIVSLERFTRERLREERANPINPSLMGDGGDDRDDGDDQKKKKKKKKRGEHLFEEQDTDRPTQYERERQQREHREAGKPLDDITELPHHADLYFNLDRVDERRPQWALPTSGTREDDGNNRPRRLSKYQYFRAFLYIAVRRAQARHEKQADVPACVLPTHDKTAMRDMRKWLQDRRKRQRQVPNFRAWAADVLKGINAWMTRVCEAVENCFHNDPGRHCGPLTQAQQEDRERMWRDVEVLFPPGVASMMPRAMRREERVPPRTCDSVKPSGTHPDAFGTPPVAPVRRLYQELFLEETYMFNAVRDRIQGGRVPTQYWEDQQRQEALACTGSGAPTRGDRLNPLICSRHFRNVILPAGGIGAPAWSQREHWVPALYQPRNSDGDDEDHESDEESDWRWMRDSYEAISEQLFPSGRRRQSATRRTSRIVATGTGAQTMFEMIARKSRKKKKKEEDGGEAEEKGEGDGSGAWDWDMYRDAALTSGGGGVDTVTPVQVTQRLHDEDKHYEKRHPNLVHGDVFDVDDGDHGGFADALFSVVCEPLMDARFLHTHDQSDMRGRVDRESDPIFADSVQRPLAYNPFYRFMHLILDVCSGVKLAGLTVDEWLQIEHFCRRILHAYETIEFDQSRILGDDRFVVVSEDGLLHPNERPVRPDGEQPKQVQAGVRALQTMAYAMRVGRFGQAMERVETMMSYVPWIRRENVLQPFVGNDTPYSTLYDYGVNAVLSMRNNALFRPAVKPTDPFAAVFAAYMEAEGEEAEFRPTSDDGWTIETQAAFLARAKREAEYKMKQDEQDEQKKKKKKKKKDTDSDDEWAAEFFSTVAGKHRLQTVRAVAACREAAADTPATSRNDVTEDDDEDNDDVSEESSEYRDGKKEKEEEKEDDRPSRRTAPVPRARQTRYSLRTKRTPVNYRH